MKSKDLLPTMLSFKIGQMKSFPDKKKLKESIPAKPILYEMLKGLLEVEREGKDKKCVQYGNK